MSFTFDELKEKGNTCVRENNYSDAEKHYSAALELNPCSHTVYSNRSLVHSKLGKFSEALHDAEKCTELDPGFARGFLRKSVAMTRLNMPKEAMEAAEQGYKLRGSPTICRDCVTQWLEANQLFNKEMVQRCLKDIGPEEDIIPVGCRIISDDYMTIFLNVFLSRLQSATTAVTTKFMLGCLLKLLDELERILCLFGHSLDTCAREWWESLSVASTVNPTTSRVPTAAVKCVLDKASGFAMWLDTSVDHSLYPILQPIFSLIALTVVSRCISLNIFNLDQPVTLTSCRACLPFFNTAPLTTAAYLLQHLSLYKELLEAFGLINYKMSSEEIQYGMQAIEETERLIKQCPQDVVSIDVCEKATVSMSLAQIRLRQTPKYDPIQYAPASGKAMSRLDKNTPEELKAYVLRKMDSLRDVLAVSSDDPEEKMGEDSYEDMQDLASCIGALVYTGESPLASEALQLSEKSFLRYFQLQISTGSFSLEEAGISFTIPRTAILRNITTFLSHNDRLLADSVIKWKCIASEFRAVLIQLGISKVYVKTFEAIQAATVQSEIDQKRVVSVAEQHNAEAEIFMGNNGQAVLSCLLQQSVEQISSLLEPGQLVLEYCYVQNDSYDNTTSTPQPSGVLVAVQAQGMDVFSIDFTKAFPLAQKWTKVLSDPKSDKEDVKSLAEGLCSTLLPPAINDLLNGDLKYQVFICPDVSLGVLPLELLLFADGKTLGEKSTITYMSSSREFLRNAVIKAVSVFQQHFDGYQEKQLESPSTVLGQSSADGATPVTATKLNDLPNDSSSSIKSKDLPVSTGNAELAIARVTPEKETDSNTSECIIVAAPNFNLEKPTTQTGLWGTVIQGFASLFSSRPDTHEDLIPPLKGAEKEATEAARILSECTHHLKVQVLVKDDATLAKVMKIQSPLILHFSTHGFSKLEHKGYRSSFWDDTNTGLHLAGANTYLEGKLDQVAVEAGTGELTALAACTMNLKGTRLVYLSACSSSYGRYSYNESISSLAEAFRSAGAETVIATLWQVVDDTAEKFATYFYNALCSSDTTCTPSQALTRSKEKLREETSYKDFIYWSSFICIGEDKPVFRII